MWSHLIKLASLGKGALVVGVAASAAMVSSAEISNTPSHHEEPSPTPVVTVVATAKPAEPTAKPKSAEPPKSADQPTANEPSKPELSGVVKECVEKYLKVRAAGENASAGDRQSASSTCKAAIEQSGLTSAEFGAKFGLTTAPSTTPKTEPKDTGLDAAIKQCLVDWRNFAETSSAACAQALAASGLSSEDFWKKFEAWAVQQQGQDQGTTADVDALVKECFAKYTAKDPTALETCKKAMAASGLSGDAFFDKYGRPTPPSAAPKSSTSDATSQLLAICFKLHSAITATTEKAQIDAAYAACNRAQLATGLSVTEFWSKFAKELTPAKPTATATPKPVTTAPELTQLIAKCIELYRAVTTTGDTHAASEACGAAIRASGMTSADFWAKYHPGTN